MSQTINGYFSTPVTLGDGGAYASPTTIGATLQASGGANALLVNDPWTVTLTGGIFGASRIGNLAEAEAGLSLDNLGIISGGGSGIDLYAGGGITNAGSITGYRYAINAYAGGQHGGDTPFFYVSNSGYLGATGGDGHAIFGGPGLVINTGTILSGLFGVLDVHTVANMGIIQANDVGVGFAPGGTLRNQPDGAISGGLFGVYANSAAVTTVANAGYIIGGDYAGVKLGYGDVTNTGTIASVIGQGVYLSQAASLTNSGLIESQDFGGIGVSLALGGHVSNTGTILGFTGLVLNGGTLVNSGVIQGETHNNNGGQISSGVNATAIDFTAPGTLAEDATGLVFGSIIGNGGALILGGGSLAQVTGFATDSFAGEATLATTLFGLGVISGFTTGDELTLTDQSATSGRFYGSALTLSNQAVLEFAGSYARNHFAVTAEPDGGTDITVACFLAGTRIATPAGETPVEQLSPGDLVHTLHAGPQPIHWVGRRGYAAPFCNHALVLPIRIAAGALAPGVPARNLFVSPGHALWVVGALIPAGRLVNGSSITQLPSAARLDYVHLELASHELLLAESCPAESLLAEGFRGLFQNAPAPEPAARPPGLPRLEHGFALQSVERRLGATQSPGAGPLRGCIDMLTPHLAAGWAQNTAAPETPVVLDLLAGGRRIARALANQYRADLRRAGIGSGNHGFSVTLPGLAQVENIRRAFDGTELGKEAVAFLKKSSAKDF